MKLKITFTDGTIIVFERIDSIIAGRNESFLDVIEDSENDHSYDLTDIASIDIHVSEVK